MTATVAAAVIARLEKLALRPSVRRDSVAADNVRLATKALRKLTRQAPVNTEPIDIFIYND